MLNVFHGAPPHDLQEGWMVEGVVAQVVYADDMTFYKKACSMFAVL